MLSSILVLAALALPAVAQSGAYGQCGGTGWTGATSCVSGYACVYSNPYYSQCVPGSGGSTTTASTTTRSSSSSTSTSTGASTTFPSKAVGKLPALGWNSWNAYGCNVDESKMLAAANQMVSLGLKAAGYQYVNIDDCWSNHNRDSQGRLQADSTKFPNGIASLASKIHGLGLKIGIYSDAGTLTCALYPASLGREGTDAATFSSWGIDYLKYDNCQYPSNWTDASNPPGGDWYNSNSAQRYKQMSAALAAQPNPIQLSICIWGNANVPTWGARVGHSWRVSPDIQSNWNSIVGIIGISVKSLSSDGFYGHGDMDMMEIGNGALTIQEQRTHFAIWAFLKSPIILGTDLSRLSSTQLAIITNKELLAFSQDDTVSAPAKPFTPSGAGTTSPPSYYAGASTKGIHVALFNPGSGTSTMSFDFASVPGLSGSSFKVHDMWTGQDVGTFSGKYSVSVASHDTAAYLVTPV